MGANLIIEFQTSGSCIFQPWKLILRLICFAFIGQLKLQQIFSQYGLLYEVQVFNTSDNSEGTRIDGLLNQHLLCYVFNTTVTVNSYPTYKETKENIDPKVKEKRLYEYA